MINILFFAQLKELFGQASVELNIETPCTVAQIKQSLIHNHSAWAEQLNKPTIMCAVNQDMVADDHIVNANDEVAFFPPVTGG
ncbi:molybdopterin synthase sulfur carrier subunit [Oceaniserpentilla sp. 4NH20-0058]|uniref:molybdopterin converting factor subunit 1 n=1 Tax=Oceaniserpentilla sp. 4NH20-0058 TaxID=3127660 RepID=UPI003107E1B9